IMWSPISVWQLPNRIKTEMANAWSKPNGTIWKFGGLRLKLWSNTLKREVSSMWKERSELKNGRMKIISPEEEPESECLASPCWAANLTEREEANLQATQPLPTPNLLPLPTRQIPTLIW